VGDLNPARFSPGIQRYRIERVGGATPGERDDVVACEEPLEIRVGYTDADGRRVQRSISITMRTPGQDFDLAAGFLYTEGIVAAASDIQSIAPCGPPAPNGLVNVIRVDLSPGVEVDLKRLERHFYTSSSGGVCGKSSLEAVAVQGRYELAELPFTISAARLERLPRLLAEQQSVFEQTGGIHASGSFDSTGELLAVREDVGRHNALDKLIGDALRHGSLPFAARGILVSGRASFELLQKAMMAGCPFLAAVGAPSSLAVELAQRFGMTLVGFLKRDQFNVYHRADRIV
jgi:FdhD protein